MNKIENLPKDVIETCKKIGNVGMDNTNNVSYYHLPQWFMQDEDGNIFECPIEELPSFLHDGIRLHSLHKIKSEIFEHINISQKDIEVCMKDFNIKGFPNSDFPVGKEGINYSKSELYHRGRLYGLERILEDLDKLK